MRNTLLILCLLQCSCFLIEKHEEVWFTEWKLFNSKDSTLVNDTTLSCIMKIQPTSGINYSGFDSFNIKVDNEGFIINEMHTINRDDFLNSNPSLFVKIVDDKSYEYFSSTFDWKALNFKDQKFDYPHKPFLNAYEYDTITKTRNLSKMKIYLSSY